MATNQTIEQLERAVRRTNRWTTSLLALLAVLVAVTCVYAAWRVQRLLQPEYLVSTAERRIRKQYPEIEAELRQQIVKSAPAIAERLSRRGLATVPEARARTERYVERKIEAGLEKAEAFSAREFRRFVRENRQFLLMGFIGLRAGFLEPGQLATSLEERLDRMLGADIRQHAGRVLNFLQQLQAKLEHLARAEKDLTPPERVERWIVRLLRAIQIRGAKGREASTGPRR